MSQEPEARRGAIGIDLGTSNSVLAFAAPAAEEGQAPSVDVFGIPQVTEIGQLETLPLLPSFLYVPAGQELPEGALSLPWEAKPNYTVGRFARDQGGKVPQRLVSSAKSWLCHSGVDRRAKILPTGKSEERVPRVSPLQASALYLLHMHKAWNHGAGQGPLAEREVILCVPASFDPAARDLTLEAAHAAGLRNLVLLEEPQAALYAWLQQQGEGWRDHLDVGDTVLVVDIGGGTTDFSLIAVGETDGSLALERIAVGDHILLGGDNMDWALAYAVRQQMETGSKKLDTWQLTALVLACRAAKETLLERQDVDVVPILIPNRGARLFKRNLKAELTREIVLKVTAEGFFPRCTHTDRPRTPRRTGLTQMGLPYAADAAITRHLAAFLGRHAEPDGEHGFVHPTALLFNGGVVKSGALRDRLLDTLNSWLAAEGSGPVRVLDGADMDRAVARGAAYYGEVRRGRGVRIRGGTASTYYVGVEQPMPAVPGFEPPLMAVCVAPFGMEEGTHVTLPGETFGLVVGEPARFRFFASAVRKADELGLVLEDWSDEELHELPEIESLLTTEDAAEAGSVVEVALEAAITEVGTLALHCASVDDSRRWKLEFSVRDTAAPAHDGGDETLDTGDDIVA